MKILNLTVLTTVSLTVLALSGCATYKDVRPSADGIHKVKILKDNGKDASREAIEQANNYCEKEQNKKKAYIVKEDQKYVGKMSEEDYQTGKTVATVLKTVGTGVMVFGGKTESNVGGIGALGGVATDAALGEGYTVEMEFKCQ